MPTEKILMGKDAILTIDGDEVLDATDVTVGLDTNMMSLPTRRTARLGWTSESPGLTKLTISFKLLVRDGESLPTSLVSAQINRETVTASALDQEGGEGPSGDFYIAKCQRAEPVEGGINYDCELTWTADNGADAPEWVGVGVSTGGIGSLSQTTASATLAAGQAGMLTTRTDDDTGIATMAAGHGIETGDVVDVYWTGGVRYGMDATVSGTAVTVDGGTGDALPVETTGLILCVQTSLAFVVIGDDLENYLWINSAKRGHICFCETDGTVVFAQEITAGVQYEWLATDPYHANPLAGGDIATVRISNGNSGDSSYFSVIAS